jgi:uncharacterized protein YcbK (DUF882 family)
MFFDHYSEVPEGYWRWENFTPKEIACRGTGKLLVNEDALDKLQALRDKIGKPFHVNSGYRSPEHNEAVGGAPNSKHMEGIAFDISLSNLDRQILYQEAMAHGFNGIGQYPSFMHIDTRQNKARWDER